MKISKVPMVRITWLDARDMETGWLSIKEIIGILSFQVINFLQLGQNDLPDTTPLPIGSL